MKIALVATYTHPLALGLRYVSSYLKRGGHEVCMVFMTSKRDSAKARFAPELIADLVERVRNAELIGMSLMTNTFYRACALTEALRSAGVRAPIVWGGVHPTVAPVESIAVADAICIGEGEQTMLELADTLAAGRDPTSIDGLWFRTNDRITHNPVRPLIADLDALPFPDYDIDQQHYVVEGKALVSAQPELMRGALTRYRVQTTRGCPFECTFCSNTALKHLYRDKGKWVRLRGNESVIAELEARTSRFPTIEAVNIVDDLFLVRPEEALAEFARLYVERINLPVELDAFPTTVTPGKIEILRRMPISLVSMGIQSGSEDTLFNLYKRRTPIGKVADAIRMLSESRIPAEYHYIINNPFEPRANVEETLRFAARHHRGPAIVRVFPLALYPGTPLHERAVTDGVIAGRHDITYEHTYGSRCYVIGDAYLSIILRAVLALTGMGLPPKPAELFVGAATARPTRWLLDRRWFVYAAYGAYRVGHFVGRRIVRQCIQKPLNLLRGKGRATRAANKRQPVQHWQPA